VCPMYAGDYEFLYQQIFCPKGCVASTRIVVMTRQGPVKKVAPLSIDGAIEVWAS
jgi:hypothetical protein